MPVGPEFDAAVISASPLGLSEALLLAREGKRVVVCDRRGAIGGAWRMEDAVGYRDVEVGCHIFIPNARVPMALSQLWGLPLAKMSPPPRSIAFVRGHYLEGPYAGSALPALLAGIRAVRLGLDSLSGRGGPRTRTLKLGLRASVKSARLVRRSFLRSARTPGPLAYPPGGTGEMVRCLTARAEEAGVVLRLGTHVTEASLSSSTATLHTADSTIIARQLVLTRGSAIPRLNGLEIPRRIQVRRHWVVVLEDPTPAAFSYLQFFRHPQMERVSDVTAYAKTMAGLPVEPSRKILCFYVTNALHDGGREAAQGMLLETMKQRGWIGAAATPVDSQWWEDFEASRDYKPLAVLSTVNPALRIVPEANLGRYLVNNFHRISTARRINSGMADEPALL